MSEKSEKCFFNLCLPHYWSVWGVFRGPWTMCFTQFTSMSRVIWWSGNKKKIGWEKILIILLSGGNLLSKFDYYYLVSMLLATISVFFWAVDTRNKEVTFTMTYHAYLLQCNLFKSKKYGFHLTVIICEIILLGCWVILLSILNIIMSSQLHLC